jgi:hypothetical protein
MNIRSEFLDSLNIHQLKTQPINIPMTEEQQEVIRLAWQIALQYDTWDQALLAHTFWMVTKKNGEIVKHYMRILNNYSIDDKPIARTVHWYWGYSNCGKSYFAQNQLEKKAMKKGTNCCFYYSLLNNSAFFDGYDGQEYCLVDDIRTHTMAVQIVLSITNFIHTRVSVKGSSKV